jgi:DNA-binding IclR family transcriptional regulator
MTDAVFHMKTSQVGVRPLTSVLKTLRVLDVLGAEGRVLRASEVARATGMSRGSAHQKLVTLVQAGWVEQTDAGAYRLTLHASRVGNAALAQASLGERVVPFLQKLVAETGETASLAVIDGDKACIVQRVESEGVLRAELRVGALLDLSHSASGRVLVAFANDDLRTRLAAGKIELPNAKLLAQVRRERFAVSSGRSFLGVRGVAAPIFERNGACVAALSLVGPLPRFAVERLRAPICRASDQINAFIRGEG